MTVYEALVEEGKRPHCERPNPCCEEPCDEPSFWDLLPQCRLNWIALGLAAFAIGFGLIGLGYLSIGVIDLLVDLPTIFADPTVTTRIIRLIAFFLGVILVSAWVLFKVCSDDWKTVVIGSLVGAIGFSLAGIGFVYSALLVTVPGLDLTWFNISISLLVASAVGFLLFAFLLFINRCHVCVSAKKGVVVSLIFLSAGWAVWALGRLLGTAVVTFEYAQQHSSTFVFPAAAYNASIFVSIANIVLALALGWYVLSCSVDNCFTVFLPLFASAAPLGNWALYRVGLHVLSYVGNPTNGFPAFPIPPNAPPPLIQFAVAVGFLSITALILSFIIANGCGDAFATAAASALPLLYAIGTYSFVATATNLTGASLPDLVTSMLRGIFSGIALTAVLVFLKCKAKCPIPRIIYGLGAGIFGWAIIYLYSTSISNFLIFSTPPNMSPEILNIGLSVIIIAAVIAVLFVRFFGCDELVDALKFTNFALLTVGAGGFIGVIAYFFQDSSSGSNLLNPADIRAATAFYVVYVLTALILPRFFVKCGGIKRQQIIALASLGFGIAAIDLGRAIAYARAVAFTTANLAQPALDFSTMVYVTSAISAVLAGQFIVWSYPVANVYTALIAGAIGLVAVGIELQIIFLVIGLDDEVLVQGTSLVTAPWLIFTLAIVGLLLFLEFKSLCIPQHCRFLIGLLIPVFGIAVFGKVAGVSAVFGAVYEANGPFAFLPCFTYTSRLILLNSIIPLTGFFVTLWAFKCTSCLDYFPSCIAFAAVVYVTGQFEMIDNGNVLAPFYVGQIWWPFVNFITSVYLSFDLTDTITTDISTNAAFITQVGLVYILFLSPALIAALVFSCSRPVSAVILGSAIAATTISFGAFGISNVIAGVFTGLADKSLIFGPISITFAQFLQGIQSQLVLLAIGVATALFIFFDKCQYRC